MKKSLKPKPAFASRSPVHGFVALCILAILDGWPIILALGLALVMSGPAKAADVNIPVFTQACKAEVAGAVAIEIELRAVLVR